ncbi:hypothetical protein PIB30_003667 [Stylosanthes scabra]|uniref:Uncharacterized protein n=1 Tax=Stylosanthes scabra TaxID=79078 RepID=A0ABU6Z262_9FABA|nr:hypothetical protein [Stylosanthes scabra]
MVNQDEEGVVYSDRSGDERQQQGQQQDQQQDQQQRNLDLNAAANGSTASRNRNVESGRTQNGQPKPHDDNSRGRRSSSAFDRLGRAGLEPNPFGGIGSE